MITKEDLIQYLITLKTQQHYCSRRGTFVEDIGPSSFIFIINSAIEVLRKETQWIPVSERLPEEELNVLVYTVDGDIKIASGAYLHYDTELNNKFVWYTDSWRRVEVAAWMHLPKPYKESEDKE